MYDIFSELTTKLSAIKIISAIIRPSHDKILVLKGCYWYDFVQHYVLHVGKSDPSTSESGLF